MKSKLIGATLALVAATAAHALLGGFGVSLTLPKAGDGEGAVLVVQPIGCHGPGASVAARAEGLVKGVRQTIPLKLYPLPGRTSPGAGDAFYVKREWPAGGAWTLVFTASKDSMTINSLVKLGAKGEVPVTAVANRSWDRFTLLPDGKTKLTPWSWTDDKEVVAMQLVSGNVNAAVDYTLRTR